MSAECGGQKPCTARRLPSYSMRKDNPRNFPVFRINHLCKPGLVRIGSIIDSPVQYPE